MAYFPFFMNLKGQCCLVIGNGAVARRKAESLRLFEAEVCIFLEGEWEEEMLTEAFLVVAATNRRSINHQIAKICREHHILVNVADSKEESTFLFPAVIKRDSVTIGISTEGSSPLIASELRQTIEEHLPEAIGERSDFMKEIRGKVKELGLSSNENKKIFKAIYEDAKQKQRKLSEKEVMDIITQLLGEKDDNVSKK